jgi:hypothetical protein
LFTGVVDTSNKFIADVVVIGEKFMAAPLIPAITENPLQGLFASVADTAHKFISDVKSYTNTSANFR